ncbi:hypothetical protein [Streptomyces sp. Ru62]|uniref:hypothetical protein n=1 Tax=Streptomyces sp. Ru62 TaxID=2080745 RepID=UPI0011B04276|nr:hypothetical protein [Streptomyces sp. Ru62]
MDGRRGGRPGRLRCVARWWSSRKGVREPLDGAAEQYVDKQDADAQYAGGQPRSRHLVLGLQRRLRRRTDGGRRRAG